MAFTMYWQSVWLKLCLLKVGDGRQEGSTQGPLIDEDAIAKFSLILQMQLRKAQQFVSVASVQHLAVHSLNRLC